MWGCVWVWLGYWLGQGPGNGWLNAEFVVVVLTLVYHVVCGRMLRQFVREEAPRGHVWYRWFNEIPVLLLTAAVILVVLKPF